MQPWSWIQLLRLCPEEHHQNGSQRDFIAFHFHQVGCRTKWSYWGDKSTPACSDGQQYRMMEDLYESFGRFRYEDIRKSTGCIKPCKYLKYSLSFALYSTISVGDLPEKKLHSTLYVGADAPQFTFSVLVSSCLWNVIKYINAKVFFYLINKFCFCGTQAGANATMVQRETLIFPLASLVAEFGGTLGLFLGFSFITLWDGLCHLSTALDVWTNLRHFCNKVYNTK